MWWTMGGGGVAAVRVRLRVYGWGRGHRRAVLATLVDRDLAVVAQREQRLLVGPEAVIGVAPFLEGGDGPLHWFGVPAKVSNLCLKAEVLSSEVEVCAGGVLTSGRLLVLARDKWR